MASQELSLVVLSELARRPLDRIETVISKLKPQENSPQLPRVGEISNYDYYFYYASYFEQEVIFPLSSVQITRVVFAVLCAAMILEDLMAGPIEFFVTATHLTLWS